MLGKMFCKTVQNGTFWADYQKIGGSWLLIRMQVRMKIEIMSLSIPKVKRIVLFSINRSYQISRSNHTPTVHNKTNSPKAFAYISYCALPNGLFNFTCAYICLNVVSSHTCSHLTRIIVHSYTSQPALVHHIQPCVFQAYRPACTRFLV